MRLAELLTRTCQDNAIANYMPHNRSSDWFGSAELLAWIFNDSPVADRKQPGGRPRVVVNDRWGYAARGQHFNYHLDEAGETTNLPINTDYFTADWAAGTYGDATRL